MPIIEAIAASNVEAVQSDKPSNDEALSEAIDISKTCQPNLKQASAIAQKLGLQGIPKKTKDFATAYPDYFAYNEASRKLNYKPKR